MLKYRVAQLVDRKEMAPTEIIRKEEEERRQGVEELQ